MDAPLLTPKQVARAIDVSQSSVKRWCDKGAIATSYTQGGHRKIAVPDLLSFLREHSYELVRPEALGLPASVGKSPQKLDRTRERLQSALLAGDEPSAIRITLDLYIARRRFSEICDDFIAATMNHIGDLWECGSAEVYQERQACEIVERILYELRKLLPTATRESPLAIGCAAPGDPYTIGSAMTELVLRSANWQTVQLGHNLPFDTIAAAIRSHQPRLFWMGCAHIGDDDHFVREYMKLYETFAPQVAFVVGGGALTPAIRSQIKFAAHCENMQQLEEFAGAMALAHESNGD